MQGRESKIEAEIQHIIQAIHHNPTQQLKNNLRSFASKVLVSGTGRPNTLSMGELREAIAMRVSITHDQKAVLHCQEATQRLLGSSVIGRRQEVLRMLLKLAQITERQQDDPKLDLSIFQQPRKLTHPTLDHSLTQVTETPFVKQQQLLAARNRGSNQQGVSQAELVRQLAFIFTNMPSTQIVQTPQGYQLRSGLRVSETVKRMVVQIGQLGWLHKKIIKAMQGEGAIRRAMRVAVQEELSQYYRWLGTIEGLGRQGRLTLRKLHVWSFHPAELLKWLTMILQAGEPFEGSHILSILHAYHPSGISAIDSLILRMLSHALQPLLNYIHQWIYKGELIDPSGQFFIFENNRISDSEEWTQRFKLIGDKVPSMLDNDSARMIYSTGKAIHFLLHRCRVLYQVKTSFLQGQLDPSTLSTGPFKHWIQTVHTQVNCALVQTLFQQFHLNYHLQSIKNFFLGGKGDFLQQLYQSLKEKLSMKKQEVTEQSLDGYISDALRNIPDFLLPDGSSHRSEVNDRLLAKKMEFGGGSEGWECFNFQYSLLRIEPLQVLFTPEVILSYQKIFSFLWRLKQIQEILKGVWLNHSRQQAARLRGVKAAPLLAIFHQAYLLRAAMLQCLTALRSYLMLTLEAAWTRFASQAVNSASFDDLLARHRAFQIQALEITLCTPREKSLQLALNNLFSVITNFRVMTNKLQQAFQEYYERLRLYQDRQTMARRGIVVQGLEVPQMGVGKSFKDLRELRNVFDSTIRNLLMLIRKQAEGRPALAILATHLDFSQHYSTLYLE